MKTPVNPANPDENHLDSLIFGDFSKKWNEAITSLAVMLDVPVAIIFKKEGDHIRVIVTNENERNPFKENDVIPVTGSFCNYVFDSNDKFKIPDYRNIDLDINNVATQADFISYLGFPLLWPNGEYFGTICILDDTTNYYSESTENFMYHFSEILNDSLKLIDINYGMQREIDELQQELQFKDSQLDHYNFKPMCKNCQRVKHNDAWINLKDFLVEHPEEIIKSIPSDANHHCN